MIDFFFSLIIDDTDSNPFVETISGVSVKLLVEGNSTPIREFWFLEAVAKEEGMVKYTPVPTTISF